jgi:hypothetical protein
VDQRVHDQPDGNSARDASTRVTGAVVFGTGLSSVGFRSGLPWASAGITNQFVVDQASSVTVGQT